MRILIADDEAPARARLASLIQELGPPWQVAGQAGDGDQVLAACAAGGVDLVLLDIRMPGTHGLAAAQRLAALPEPPAVIFTTAFEQHALAAFEADAVDYLLKPIRKDRLLRALQKAAARAGTPPPGADDGPALSVSQRGELQRIPLAQVICLQADSKYVRISHAGGEALSEDSLVSIEEHFPGRFLRVHRAVLVDPARMVRLARSDQGAILTLRGLDEAVPVSRRHLPEVRQRLKGGA